MKSGFWKVPLAAPAGGAGAAWVVTENPFFVHKEAIAALLTQRNVEAAAKSVGISTKALLRWMKDPEV